MRLPHFPEDAKSEKPLRSIRLRRLRRLYSSSMTSFSPPRRVRDFDIVRCMFGLMMNGVTEFRGRHQGRIAPPPRQALNFLRGDGDFFADDICKYWEAGYIMPPIHS